MKYHLFIDFMVAEFGTKPINVLLEKDFVCISVARWLKQVSVKYCVNVIINGQSLKIWNLCILLGCYIFVVGL